MIKPKQLLRYREKHDYTQEFVATKIGLTQQAYGDYENGDTRVPAHRAQLLAKLYNVTLVELQQDVDERQEIIDDLTKKLMLEKDLRMAEKDLRVADKDRIIELLNKIFELQNTINELRGGKNTAHHKRARKG